METFRNLEPVVWSEKQFGTCELGDRRRTERLVRYAQQMAEKPDASTPKQTETWSDCKAVYRLFARPEVTFEAVTQTHYQNTQSMPPGRYLVISDTTEIDFGYKSPRAGLGQLTGKHRRGFFLHSSLIVDAETHAVTGLGKQELWARPLSRKKRVHRVKCRKRATESDVWGRNIDAIIPSQPGVTLIHICDRGADNFDVFAHLSVRGDSWVIRAAQLTRYLRNADGETEQLSEIIKAAPLKGTYQLWIKANKKQAARCANIEVFSTSATLLRPREGATEFVMDNGIEEIETNIVIVKEVNAPRGADPIQWVLYTKESVTSFNACYRVIEHYEQRPIVEEFHKGLKTGLSVEQRQYAHADRLEPLIGVSSVQAVRLLQLRDVSRRAPDTPARKVVPAEWIDVLQSIQRRPRKITTVRDFTRALASLGGFLGRKSDGDPGWQTLWHGLETLLTAIRGAQNAIKNCG
jgi:hypothetical protein